MDSPKQIVAELQSKYEKLHEEQRRLRVLYAAERDKLDKISRQRADVQRDYDECVAALKVVKTLFNL